MISAASDALLVGPGENGVRGKRSRGVKKRSRTSPTWFSTCPFSQPEAGVRRPAALGNGCTSAGGGDCIAGPCPKDRLHRRLHVVVDAARAGPAEESEGPVVGIEHHLLRLAWIGPHEHHTDVAEPDMYAFTRVMFSGASFAFRDESIRVPCAAIDYHCPENRNCIPLALER